MKSEKETNLALSIGSNIRKVRTSQGLKLEDMSLMLGISDVQCSKIETGGVDITLSRLIKICEGLKVPLHELVDHELVPHTSDEVEQIRKKYNQANEKIIELQQRLLIKQREEKFK